MRIEICHNTGWTITVIVVAAALVLILSQIAGCQIETEKARYEAGIIYGQERKQ